MAISRSPAPEVVGRPCTLDGTLRGKQHGAPGVDAGIAYYVTVAIRAGTGFKQEACGNEENTPLKFPTGRSAITARECRCPVTDFIVECRAFGFRLGTCC